MWETQHFRDLPQAGLGKPTDDDKHDAQNEGPNQAWVSLVDAVSHMGCARTVCKVFTVYTVP